MPTSDAALKKLTRFAWSPAYFPGDAVPTTYSRQMFEDFQPNARREQVNQQQSSGGMGHLSNLAPNVRNNRYLVEPRMAFKPNIAEWALLLPWLLNSTSITGSGTLTYNLGQLGSRRTIAFDDTQKVWVLAGVQCGRWTLTAEAGGEVMLEVEAAGVSYDDTFASAFPTAAALVQAPDRLLAGDNAISAGGITNPIRWRRLTLSVDHGLSNDRYFGTFTSAGPINTSRTVALTLELPYALSQQLYAAGSLQDGLAMSVGFTVPTYSSTTGLPTGGSKSLVFNLAGVKAPPPPVQIEDPEAFMTWEGLVTSTTAAANTGPAYGGELEMTAVLDTTA